ncbi:MAG: type I restriction endonuclease subunit R [Candidatus Methanomethylicaceae archaeon]|jgi:type I restriction enzyme R subunit
MSKAMVESEVETVVLDILSEMGYSVKFGPDLAPDGLYPERKSYLEVILFERLSNAIAQLNPKIPTEIREMAVKKFLHPESQSLMFNNRLFHRMAVEGIPVEYKRVDGTIAGDTVHVIDFENIENNEFLAVNQFTVIENNDNRRPDVVIFINGIPLVVIELKNPADQNATILSAFNQFQTYKQQIPSLFNYNEFLIISDGIEARVGTISSDKERFMPWKILHEKEGAPHKRSELETLLKNVCNKNILLDLARHFIVFEEDKTIIKKMAAYHQYYAVNKAVERTLLATSPFGDKRCGVVWHTQGSGKSLSMVFYSGKLILSKELENPTIVVLTDRNDLDDQLYGTFCRCKELLRQDPVQAESRDHLKELLKVASGGVIFTTAQKFLPDEKGDQYPLLTSRRNVIVIADEAHRSQYDFIDGFARHLRDALPNASFIGFTGTPIEKEDRSTPAVFGEYIDIYDIQQAVEDGATVRIYYESRLAKLELKEEERPKIDKDFEEVTEGEEVQKKERLKSKWSRQEAIVGSEKRVRQIARDIVDHFENRLSVMDGKGMIVCMSRRICVDLYNTIVQLRPAWANADDDKGFLKVVITGSASDPLEWQQHVRNKPRRKAIGDRVRDPSDPLKLVIVRDMWLTGFDVPNLHTMYVDKPMKGHTLMQAIARVNRVFKDKPGGLIVDYLGFASELKQALAEYTEGDQKDTGIPQEEAVALMLEKYEIVDAMYHGFDYARFLSAPPREKLSIIPLATDHILKQDGGKERYMKYVTELSKAFALSVPNEEALKIRDRVGFFQLIRAGLVKTTETIGKPEEELDTALKQIVSKAITTGEVIDLFATAGLKKPDISILSPEFLAEVKDLPYKNLALELLQKLLNDEIKIRLRKNLIQGKAFSEKLDNSIRKYQNKTIEAAQVIEELIELAKEMREANKRGEALNLSEEELAFYDALGVNDSAVKILGDETLRKIAQELTVTIRQNVSIDWTLKTSIQAKLKVMVKRVLRKYGYPPDKQQKATDTVLEQATLLCRDWAEMSA